MKYFVKTAGRTNGCNFSNMGHTYNDLSIDIMSARFEISVIKPAATINVDSTGIDDGNTDND